MSGSYFEAGLNVPTFSRFCIFVRLHRPHEPSSRSPGRPSPVEVEAGGHGNGRSQRNGRCDETILDILHMSIRVALRQKHILQIAPPWREPWIFCHKRPTNERKLKSRRPAQSTKDAPLTFCDCKKTIQGLFPSSFVPENASAALKGVGQRNRKGCDWPLITAGTRLSHPKTKNEHGVKYF